MELDEIFHEFRNSLTVIGGFARRLLKQNGLEESKYKNYAQRIAKDVERLESILNQPKGGNNMFYGRWNTKIDEKWRLYIPPIVNKELGRSVLLKEEEKDGCIVICKTNLSGAEDPSLFFIEKIRNGGRVRIPDFLRDSNSFYYGKSVTVAGRGDHLKIMPRP